MGLTATMLTGFTGITSNTVGIDTVGNNLANLNTTAFKNERTMFETLLYNTISEGEGPGASSGGTSPRQIGSGVGIASLQRDFGQGGFDATGFQSDLAIDGDGFFVLNGPGDQQLYSRDGSFSLDATQTLVSANGAAVQVFEADSSGAISVGTLSDLVIPLGTASQAVPTTLVNMDGRLDPSTSIASTGAVVASQALMTSGGQPATAGTALTNLVDESGVPLFATGDELSIAGSKGGIATSEATFVVGETGSTVGDLMTQLEAIFGINTAAATGGTPGVRIGDGTDGPAGAIVLESNPGELNAVQLDSASILNRTGINGAPFSFTTTTEALGGGVTTTFGVFDSLGTNVDVRLRAVLESKSEAGTVWRFYAESVGDSDLSPALGTGTISFDPNGQFIAATGTDITIDRAGEGSTTPIALTLDLSGLTGLSSTTGSSELIMASQNGAPPGTMTNYAINRDGIVTAVFSNQQQQVLGQIAMATFVNNEGLVAGSDNTFVPGPNAGEASVIAPQTGRAGSIISGALEQSNVKIAREFVNLITYSTGVSAASRVVRSADDLLQELLLLAR
jgi:flagellar hook protein FlgE